MSRNRRNYYRVLGVQPDAPQELVRASYRTLMSTLRGHPDLGGDHETAALINEAWAVLGDPARRQAYDRANPMVLAVRRGRAANGSAPSGGNRGAGEADPAQRGAGPRPAAAARPQTAPRDTAAPAAAYGCPMCGAPLPARIGADTRCLICTSPLAPPHEPSGRGELFGRRRSVRSSKNQLARMRVAGTTALEPVVVTDLSLTGIGLIAREHPGSASIVRIRCDDFDVVAEVLRARRVPRGYALNARLLRARFERCTGTFVSRTA